MVSNEITEDEAFLELLDCLPDRHNQGDISCQDFLDYYAGVSLLVQNDQHFNQLMSQAWRV